MCVCVRERDREMESGLELCGETKCKYYSSPTHTHLGLTCFVPSLYANNRKETKTWAKIHNCLSNWLSVVEGIELIVQF